MLSFKHFRPRDEANAEDLLTSYQRVISLLLNGTVVHAVRGDASDYKCLDDDISSLRDEITSGSLSAGDLLIKTGAALKALQEYNRRTSNFNNAQTVELQSITAMLTGAIANLSVSGSTNVARLQVLERELEHAASLDNVRLLKDKLSDCLIGLREEKIRQKTASESAVNDLAENLRVARVPATKQVLKPQLVPSSPPSLDGTTGLGSRPSAENAIAVASDGSSSVYAVLFVIDHLHGLNTRFGRAVGDQIILLVAQHLAEKLAPEDIVFRWSGPAFLALIERDEPLDRVRRLLAPVTNARLEKMVELRERTVLLPINLCWTLLPIPSGGKATAVIDKMDAFLASKVGHES